jgi:Zn ribbon nucleic-acid-binding protein
MATATATKKSNRVFEGLRCPHCGEVDCLDVRVENLVVECRECSEEITKAEVDEMIAQWTKLFAWLAMAE